MGSPYVLYVQDLWPDSVFATQFLTQSTVRRVLRGLDPYLQQLYRSAAHVVAITPGMRETLVERGLRITRSVVYNWVDEQVMRPRRPNGRLRAAAGVGRDAVSSWCLAGIREWPSLLVPG